jgi:hypothetical protein
MPWVAFFYTALAPFNPIMCDGAMFKYIIRVCIGAWWILLIVQVLHLRFACPSQRQYFLLFLWLDVPFQTPFLRGSSFQYELLVHIILKTTL